MKDLRLPVELLKDEDFPGSHTARGERFQETKFAAILHHDAAGLSVPRAEMRDEKLGKNFQPGVGLDLDKLFRHRPAPLGIENTGRTGGGQEKPGTAFHTNGRTGGIRAKEPGGWIDDISHQNSIFLESFAEMEGGGERLLPKLRQAPVIRCGDQMQLPFQSAPLRDGLGRDHTKRYSDLSQEMISSLPFSALRSAKRNGRAPRMRWESSFITSKSAPT